MTTDPLDLIITQATERQLKAGGVLIHEGSVCRALHLLVDGWAVRYTGTGGGARQILAVLLPGDFCNLESLALLRPDYGIQALTPAKFLGLERGRAIELSQSSKELAQLFLSRMAIENAMLGRWALALGRKSAMARLAHLLCELAVRLEGAIEDDAVRLDLPLKQEQIADVLGLTPVHVNRTLQRLRFLGVIESRGRIIDIPSVAKLSDIAEFDERYLHRSEAIASRLPSHISIAGSSASVGQAFP